MNRLILLGNGFDLAHGMRTGYKDFMLWYLKKCLKITDEKKEYRDDLLDINIEIYNHSRFSFGVIGNTNELVDYLYENNQLLSFFQGKNIKFNQYQDLSTPFKSRVKSRLLQKLLTKCNLDNWVDIEQEFYMELKIFLQDPNGNLDAILALNHSLSILIKELGEYLSELPTGKINRSYIKLLSRPVTAAELIGENLGDIDVEKTMVLNFNYTSTAEQYVIEIQQHNPDQDITMNYIHGKLGDEKNPLVFGFGDELDEHYKLMEDSQQSAFLKYIKSFWYFRTSNYRNLIRFLNAKNFQVYTFGHSCGLSDRTMLNTIFEHENCRSIKIFYYQFGQQNNFTSITEEISRHFRNKPAMRDRIVSFDISEPMPQTIDEN